jgi:hypothetical protein
MSQFGIDLINLSIFLVHVSAYLYVYTFILMSYLIKPTQCSRNFVRKLVVTHLVKIFPAMYGTLVIVFVPDESNLHRHIVLA